MAKSTSTSKSTESTVSQSTTKNLLDEELLAKILGGLSGQMTQEEIESFAQNLLMPELNAGLEAAQQEYETTKLAKEQEIENLAREFAKSIEEQNTAYRQSMANVETAALNRGMGRSSYTLETLANQGNALAKAVMELTDEQTRQSEQIQQQITQAAQQKEQTQGRLNTDYASQLAAKIQELTQQQRQEANSNYLTAISSAMGQQTIGSSQTQGTTSTITGSGSSGSSSSSSKTGDTYTVYQSGARRTDTNKGSGANPKYTGGNLNVSIN